MLPRGKGSRDLTRRRGGGSGLAADGRAVRGWGAGSRAAGAQRPESGRGKRAPTSASLRFCVCELGLLPPSARRSYVLSCARLPIRINLIFRPLPLVLF